MKPKRKERHRSTNLELLGGVSLGALRTLRDIAGKADLPLARVFSDVVAIGLSVVSDPEESPYQSLIAFRAGLAQKQAELENVEAKQASFESQTGRDPGEGEDKRGSLLQVDSQERATLGSDESAIEYGPGVIAERPRLESESQADTGLLPVES